MRLPLPERIPLKWGITFILLLYTVQVGQGANALFSLLCAVYLFLALLAFNVAGGMTRPSGCFIFFNVSQTALIGFLYKIALREPADSHLSGVPNLVIGVYAAGMGGMLLSAYLSRKFSRKRGWLADVLPVKSLYRSALGCFLFAGVVLVAVLAWVPNIAPTVDQLNKFMPLAMILAITYEVRTSGGTRSMNAVVWLAGAYIFISTGLLTFSKEGMLLPFACWLGTVAACRYRLVKVQIVGLALAGAFLVLYMVPYSQVGRAARGDYPTFRQRTTVAVYLLQRLDEVRQMNNDLDQISAEDENAPPVLYFDKPQRFADRMNMISIDSALIAVTRLKGQIGFLPLQVAFLNVFPHVIWPDKPVFNTGNIYGHEIDVLAPEDFTTSVAFSGVADIYHQGGWLGVIAIAPLIWTLLFLVYDSVCGDIRASPWGILALVAFVHTAPEATLSGLVYMATTGIFAMICVAFLAARVLPLLSTLAIGPPRTPITPHRTPMAAIAE